MTADVELLPLPRWMETYRIPGDDFHTGPDQYLSDRMQAYARACVEANLALLQAENERLRAEVERLRADRDSWEQQASDRVADWHAEHLRAERLAEALALLPDEIVMVEHNPYEGPLMFCCGQRVTLSWHHGLEPTHGKECWYARMRALRDHDQENKA